MSWCVKPKNQYRDAFSPTYITGSNYINSDACFIEEDCCLFTPDDAYCSSVKSFSNSGAPCFPSILIFFSSLTSKLPDYRWVKGFSRSVPSESWPPFSQGNEFLCRPEKKHFSRKYESASWQNPSTSLSFVTTLCPPQNRYFSSKIKTNLLFCNDRVDTRS